MEHSVKISVSKSPSKDGIIACKVVPIKNRFLRKLLGDVDRMTVLIPGDTVQDITICEVKPKGVAKDAAKNS